MSIFKKIKNVVTGEEVMRAFCEHLRQIGVNATLLESGSPEAIGPRMKKGPFASEHVLGNIRIEGQNIDLLQVGRQSVGGGEGGGRTVNQPFYVVRAKVEGLESNLEAKGKSIRRGFFSKEVVDFQWEEGDLARRLNADADLKTMVLSTGLVDIVTYITCDKNNQCVRIWGHLGFPTRETFDIYDRIASHIRSITDVRF